jgi:multidrug transporter EmrE-like cation transporter
MVRFDIKRHGVFSLMASAATTNLALILFTVTTNAAAQLLLKRGMTTLGELQLAGDRIIGTIFSVVFNPFVFAGLATFVISMASHLIVLSRVQLSYAYPFLSLAYVIVAVASWHFFAEDLGVWRIAGIALICLGTVFIAQS